MLRVAPLLDVLSAPASAAELSRALGRALGEPPSDAPAFSRAFGLLCELARQLRAGQAPAPDALRLALGVIVALGGAATRETPVEAAP